MRVVFDTNVLFAALVSRGGFCAQIVEESLANHEICFSQFIIGELVRNLERKLGVEKHLIDNAIESLTGDARFVEPAEVAPSIIRDPNDLSILGTAIAAKADVLVSGDKDLLALGSLGTIPILSPRQFHERYFRDRV